MNIWITVIAASLVCFVLKYAGHLVPQRLLEGERTAAITELLPVALLSALVVTQTFTAATGALVLDARAAGLAVAVVALLLRAPFIVVVVLAAAVTAGLRAMGWS